MNWMLRVWRNGAGSLCLVLLLFVGHLHLCSGAYYLPDGSRCETCPNLADDGSCRDSGAPGLGERHGDCHDCCVFAACDSGHGFEAWSGRVIDRQGELSAVLPPGLAMPERARPAANRERLGADASAPGFAPPRTTPARGPPVPSDLC